MSMAPVSKGEGSGSDWMWGPANHHGSPVAARLWTQQASCVSKRSHS